MQSDERVVAALSALRPQIAQFRFAVSCTLERARNTLASESGPRQTGVALGDFANGRIDPERFSMISAGSSPLDVTARAVVERAADVLESILGGGDEEFVVDVPVGTSPAAAIRARLMTLGSAFGIATLVEQVRRRTYDTGQLGLHLPEHPFEKWTAAERKLPPPVVVRLSGRDLDAFELASLMDGCARLVLIVDEPCAPAPLVRLISPGVFVAQTADSKVVETLVDFDGPAVIAVMNGAQARFVHNPRAGLAMWQRLEVAFVPEARPRKSLGVRSAWQQRDDLSHLKALMEQPRLSAHSDGESSSPHGGGTSDPAEKLTAWLIGQAGLQGSTA